MIQTVTNWAPAVLPALAFAALLYVPGAVVLWMAGARRSTALGLAPLLSTALLGAGSAVMALVGVPFGLPTFAVLAVLVSAAALLTRLASRRGLPQWRRPTLPSGWIWIVPGLLVNAVIVAWLYMRPAQAADNPAYEYDTIWHFAVIRRFLETANYSSLDVGLLDGTVGTKFYPAAWHGLVALTVEATGASIAAAVNGAILVLVLVTWPLGMVWLSRTLFGEGRALGFATSALAFLPAVFPIGFLTFGLLYSNLFSYAVLPLAAVLLITLLRRIGERDWVRLRADALPLVLGVAAVPVAFLFAQPNSAFTLLVVLLPLAYRTLHQLLSSKPRWLRPAGHALFTALLAVLWVGLHDSSFLERTINVTIWNSYQSPAQAVGEWMLFGNGTDGQLLLGAVVVLGALLVVLRGPQRWWVGSWALLGALFVVCTAAEGGTQSLRSYLVGFWYTDSTRLSAASAIVALPLAAFAIAAIARWLEARWDRAVPARLRASAHPLLAGALIAVVVAVSVGVEISLKHRSAHVAERNHAGEDQWLSPAESDFLDDVAAEVGTDAVIANNPFDGSAVGYAFDELDVLFSSLPGNWMGSPTPEQELVRDRFSDFAEDDVVCAAVRELDIEYALVLHQGARPVFTNGPHQFPGLVIDASTPGLETVLERDGMALYRLDACIG